MNSTCELEKALNALGEALRMQKSSIVRDATIQRFKFCVELSWKTAKKILGTNTGGPKPVFREMAQAGLIEDPVFWLEAVDMRNLSSHTYKEELAEKVYAYAKDFHPIAAKLLERLKLS